MAVAPAIPGDPDRRAPGRGETRSYEHQLLARYHREGDIAARDELVERLIPFTRRLAARYAHSLDTEDDLFQVACVGLLKAIDRFDLDRGVAFTSFAAPSILGELKRHFRDKGWAVRMPRDLQERVQAMNRHTEALSARLGRSPTLRELANAAGCSVEDAIEASQASMAYQTASLDAPAGNDDDAGTLIELIGEPDPSYDLVATRDAMAHGWRELSPDERQAVELRFVRDLTQSEIGERMGYSQMHISRLLRRALSRLQESTAAA
jgi:RNA polymerase sigma-B factor